MGILFSTYIITSIIYLVVGVVTIMNNHRQGINKIFLTVCLNLSFWAFVLGIAQLLESAEQVTLCRNLTIISWSALYVQIVYFTIYLTNRHRLINTPLKNFMIMTFPIIVFLYYLANPAYEVDVIKSDYGWLFLGTPYRGFMYNQLFNVYYILYMAISIYFVVSWRVKTKSKREKKQGDIIILGFVLVLILGTIADIILPIIGLPILPPISVVLILGVIISMCYSIIKYKLMNITPESIMKDVFLKIKEGIIITDHNNKIIGINQGVKNITKYSENELVGRDLSIIIDTLDNSKEYTGINISILDRYKNVVEIMLSKIYQYDQFDMIVGTVYTFQDITLLKNMQNQLRESKNELERKVYDRTRELSFSNDKLKKEILIRMEKEQEINRLIYTDYLTGLPNRRFLSESISRSIEVAIENATRIGIIFLDLDNFKLINDTKGHDVGDTLLREVGMRLKRTLRNYDCVSRVGGDEFVIVLENIKRRADIEKVCNKVLDMFKEEFHIDNEVIHVKSSIGVSVFPDDGTNIDSIIENADIAMYKVKESDKNGYMFYSSDMRSGLDEAMFLTNELYSAIGEEQFEMYFQPQVDSQLNKIKGFEALIRWNHPTIGLIYPGSFIHLAEKSGTIITIGEFVIRKTFEYLKKWMPYVDDDFKIGINISASQMMKRDFSSKIEVLLDEIKIPSHMIELELTESLFFNKSEVVEYNIEKLKSMGFLFAIDDFGTEYATMTYLRFIPLNRIKIPKTFIEGIATNTHDEAIIKSIIILAKELGCEIIAEGVEQYHQVKFLQDQKCDMIQGYYYYKPLAAKVVEKLLNDSDMLENSKEYG